MCLLFLYLNPNPKWDEYQLILASSRDEFYNRRTDTARFWDPDFSIIGGTDQMEGRQGGTWLAMNRNGKIAALLNILQPADETHPDKKGRGFFVRDFVRGSQDPMEFLHQVNQTASEYNGFLLVTLDVHRDPQDTSAAYFTNMSPDPPRQISSPGVHVFGNSPPIRLWEKAVRGRELFEQLIGSGPTVSEKDDLVRRLLQFLKDSTLYPLDDQIFLQGRGMAHSHLEKLNSLFVSIPALNYGTRSHTLILIDAQGGVEYVESSMKEPISLKQANISWLDVKETFSLVDLPQNSC